MNKKKRVALIAVLILVIGGVIAGTLAWLTDETASVINTFTTSGIDITLEEEAGGEKKEFKMIPGHTIDKDPVVMVKANSEPCWLFVKVEKSTNFDDFLTYAMTADWTQGDGTDIPANVYYRGPVASSADDQPFGVIKDDEVVVKDTVTKADMDELTAETYPTLTFTAYASQYWTGKVDSVTDLPIAFTAAEAWPILNP